MAGPAAALIPLTEGVRKASTALTADLVVFEFTIFRKVSYEVDGEKREFLTPIDVETHINALGLGILGVVATVGALGAWVLWNGLVAPAPAGPIKILPGLKDSPYWEERAETARRCGEIRRLLRNLRKIAKERPELEDVKAGIVRLEQEKSQIGCRF